MRDNLPLCVQQDKRPERPFCPTVLIRPTTRRDQAIQNLFGPVLIASRCQQFPRVYTCRRFVVVFGFKSIRFFWYRFRYRFQVYLFALCFSYAVPSMDISRGRYLKARIAVDEFNFVLLITNYVSSHGATYIHIHTYPYPSHIVCLSNNFISQLRDASSWSL